MSDNLSFPYLSNFSTLIQGPDTTFLGSVNNSCVQFLADSKFSCQKYRQMYLKNLYAIYYALRELMQRMVALKMFCTGILDVPEDVLDRILEAHTASFNANILLPRSVLDKKELGDFIVTIQENVNNFDDFYRAVFEESARRHQGSLSAFYLQHEDARQNHLRYVEKLFDFIAAFDGMTALQVEDGLRYFEVYHPFLNVAYPEVDEYLDVRATPFVYSPGHYLNETDFEHAAPEPVLQELTTERMFDLFENFPNFKNSGEAAFTATVCKISGNPSFALEALGAQVAGASASVEQGTAVPVTAAAAAAYRANRAHP